MLINGIAFGSDLGDILTELQTQLHLNQIPYLQTMKETSTHFQVSCPYHKDGQERKPSMGIRKSDGKCHCFTCGKVVELQELISFCFGHTSDYIGAFGWNWLIKNFATISVEERKPIQLNLSRGKKFDVKQFEYVSEEELDSYRYTHPYWEKRGITNGCIIDLFDLGYDKKTDCITMPVRDESGKCRFVARRSVKTKYFNYPRGAEKPLYGLFEYESVRNKYVEWYCGAIDFREWKDELIVCESMIDALTAWQYGRYAVALNGVGSEQQFRDLSNVPCRKLILATDMDDAGKEARQKIKDNVKGKIITEYMWDLSVAKDLNDMDIQYFQGLQEVF